MISDPTTTQLDLEHRRSEGFAVSLSLVPVGSFATGDEAELAEMMLWAAGIRYVLDAADARAISVSDSIGAVRIFVDEHDAGDAAALLSDHSTTTGKE